MTSISRVKNDFIIFDIGNRLFNFDLKNAWHMTFFKNLSAFRFFDNNIQNRHLTSFTVPCNLTLSLALFILMENFQKS